MDFQDSRDLSGIFRVYDPACRSPAGIRGANGRLFYPATDALAMENRRCMVLLRVRNGVREKRLLPLDLIAGDKALSLR